MNTDNLVIKLKEGNEKERLAALRHLEQQGDETAINALVDLLTLEHSRLVQEAAVAALIRINMPQVAEAVVQLLESTDAWVRNAAVEILQGLGETASDVVRDLLQSFDPDLRLFAVNVLGEAKYRKAVSLLQEVVNNDSNVNVVAAAVEYLGEMGSRVTDVRCLENAGRRFKDPFLHYAVDEALKKIGHM
ncbi:MAG: HEAT repeat domain-containing protein [Peptococcaceae bacterium]|nr:HEAT repeat domain-containing protein [Peptococcaceae bacterium]